jgi:hypothetical protein
MKKQINLYVSDFNFLSQWKEICEQLDLDHEKVSGVTITYIDVETCEDWVNEDRPALLVKAFND